MSSAHNKDSSLILDEEQIIFYWRDGFVRQNRGEYYGYIREDGIGTHNMQEGLASKLKASRDLIWKFLKELTEKGKIKKTFLSGNKYNGIFSHIIFFVIRE